MINDSVAIGKRSLMLNWKKHNAVQSLWLTLLAVGFMFLLFEPTSKSDDYDMCNLLYGGVTGEYSAFMMYANILWGEILKIFLRIAPNVSWYYVLQYLLMFAAMVFINYILLEHEDRGRAVYFGFTVFVGYEFFIRVTFSKTAGLLMAAGYFVLLYSIVSAEKLRFYIAGLFFMFFGMIIRNHSSFFLLITVIFAVTFVVHIIQNQKDKKLLKDGAKFVAFVLALYLMNMGLAHLNAMVYANSEDWNDYMEINAARARVVDYGVPDYTANREKYEALGISQNDYQMWFEEYNRGDNERLTVELYNNIRNIQPSDAASTAEKISGFMKSYLGYFFNNTVFYPFLAVAVLLLCSVTPRKFLLFGMIWIDLSFCYAVLFLNGRTQHHIDAAMLFAGCLLIMYYTTYRYKKERKLFAATAILLLCGEFGLRFFSEISSSSYYGVNVEHVESEEEHYKENYERFSVLSNDKDTLYLIEAMETNTRYPCFSVFQVFEKGFYSNIYRLNMNIIQPYTDILKDTYGVENVFSDIVNNENMYFVAYKEPDAEIMLQYIRENYNPNAQMALAKQIDGMNIYFYYDDSFVPELQEKEDAGQRAVCDFVYDRETGTIQGVFYQKGTDSYKQKIYLEIYDEETGTSKYELLCQQENPDGQITDNGKYGAFSGTVDMEFTHSDKIGINLILVNEKNTLKYVVQ